jgi:hypothetical protein
MKINGQRILRAAITIVVLLVVSYIADWGMFQFRVKRGTAYGTVNIHQFLATSLKGDKTEFDMTGTVQQTCSHSMFPQNGNSACWWLERHTSQWQ